MIDQDTKEYFDQSFKVLYTKIESIESSLSLTINPIKDDVARLRADIADIYEKKRKGATDCEDHRERIGARIGALESWKEAIANQMANKRWSIEQVFVVLGILAMVLIWVLDKFSGGPS